MLSLSSYFSVTYLALILPVTVVLYAVLPQRFRRLVLLAASYVFFWAVSEKLLVFLLAATCSIHYFGLWLADMQRESDTCIAAAPKEQRKELRRLALRKQRFILAFAVGSQLGTLLVLKYTPFFTSNINSLLQFAGSSIQFEIPAFVMPIGISFYTMQAMSYLFDVYRKIIPADRNLFRLALFMSFFPQIMEGPICRYSETAEQLWEAPKMQYQNFLSGIQRIFYGVMKKLVVADRLNLFIKNIFSGYENYDGFVIAVAAVCYTLQLYMDFSGTMDLVIGSGEIFGITMPENFKRPFFSASISEFWKRWHITLGAWFKDYIFYPMSMSKPLKKLTVKARKKLGNHFGPLIAGSMALFCVWLSNGLWHGAGWHYIFFGMYHFALILCGSIFEPFVLKITGKLHISRSSRPYRCMQIIRTGILVCIGELFFRAHGLRAGLVMFKKMVTDFRLTTVWDQSFFTLGMDRHDFLITAVFVVFLFIIGIYQEKGVVLRQCLARRNVCVQYLCFYALIMFVVIFGAYGRGYVPVDPMYAGF